LGKAGRRKKMEKLTATKILSLPQHPPLKGGEFVKIEEGVYALILEPLADEPGAYRSVPFKGTFEMVPVDLLVHEELIEGVVGKVHPLLLEIAREVKKRPVWVLGKEEDEEFLRRLMAIQWGSEFCLTEPWQRVVVCKKATILITESADLGLLKFSRFGKASVRELPSGELEVVLTAGTAYFYGGIEVLPSGDTIKKGAPVKLFVEGEEVVLDQDEDLVLYVRGDESLPEVRVIF
jgi:hypothetical protein